MNKYGEDKFVFEIIEECNKEEMDVREKYWIDMLNTLEPNGYNIKHGGNKLFGQDNPFYGKKHTQKTKETISKKNKGRKVSEEERRLRSNINKGNKNPFFGKHHTDETKEKIKNTNIAKGNYQKTSERMKVHNPNDGSLFRKIVIMLDKNLNFLNIFESATKAGEYIKGLNLTNAKFPSNSISEACRMDQKTAFGYIWRYVNPVLIDNYNDKTTGYIISRKNLKKAQK